MSYQGNDWVNYDRTEDVVVSGPVLFSDGTLPCSLSLAGLPDGSSYRLSVTAESTDRIAADHEGFEKAGEPELLILQSGVNRPPVTLCQIATVPAGPTCTAEASIDGGSYDCDGDPITLLQSPQGPYSLGETSVTLTGEDGQGASSSCVATVTVTDDTPPHLACPEILVLSPDASCEAVMPDLLPEVLASDNCTASEDIDFTQDPAAGTLLGLGSHPVTVAGNDAAGHHGTCITEVAVWFDFDGFLPPLGGADDNGGCFGDPVGSFKLGRIIPVKFRIQCADNLVLTGTHILQVVPWTDETTPGEPIDAVARDASAVGNEFRLAEDHWHFTLDPRRTGMSPGQWQLMATLSDGSQHSVWIEIR